MAESMRKSFLAGLSFAPDTFQVEAFDAFDDDQNVIVAAPTGAGKTLVANYAISAVLRRGARIFYTTPIKALSNQKYHDLGGDYGYENVGLLTGDTSINKSAPIIVMTTEVLRNMLYENDPLANLQAVVLDEVHYLQDAYRGSVWEEVIIHLPKRIKLVCLSATVSNADELREWIETVRGETTLVVEHTRPVQLKSFYMVAERGSKKTQMTDVLRGSKPHPEGFQFDTQFTKRSRSSKGRSKRKRRWTTPRRLDALFMLKRKELLPAIHFIFSRAACDEAALSVARSGVTLISDDQCAMIDQVIAEKIQGFSKEDLAVLRFEEFRSILYAGAAAHHAGMVPLFKEIVESCFIKGLLKIVYATETLALGVNMPARAVVLDKVTKYNGEGHDFLTPAQFAQLTGRAGRRGIDTKGSAVILWSPFVTFKQVAGLAASKDFVLSSSFRPDYNMAANFVRRYEPQQAKALLNMSFAQFRADAGVVHSEQKIEQLDKKLDRAESKIVEKHGALEETLSRYENGGVKQASVEDISFALSQCVPGEVYHLTTAKEEKVAVAVAVYSRKGGRIKAKFVDVDGQIEELAPTDLFTTPRSIATITLPEPYLPNSVIFAGEVGERLAKVHFGSLHAGATKSVQRQKMSAEDRKEISRYIKIKSEKAALLARSAKDSNSLAAQLERVVDVLREYGCVQEWELSSKGERVARLYHESDLLIVQCLEKGVFDGLNPAELAAVASIFCFEDRRHDEEYEPWFPSPAVKKQFHTAQQMQRQLNRVEQRNNLKTTKEVDAGFVALAHGWAAGGDLDEVLASEDIKAGDFVRVTKQLIDLVKQIASLASDRQTARAARSAADKLYRGLVAMSGTTEVTGETHDNEDASDAVEDDDS